MSTDENIMQESLCRASIQNLRQELKGEVLVFATSYMEMEILPQLYNVLSKLSHVEKLNVVLYTKGGSVNAARRIGLLLREFAQEVTFVTPYYCESAGTLLCLSGSQILAGSMSIFTPIDPQLGAEHGNDEASGSEPGAMSCEDVRLFSEMAESWFGLEREEAQHNALQVLSNSIFPTTLTSFYRSAQEVQKIAMELLSYQLPEADDNHKQRIVDKLLFGFHSHSYAITSKELEQMGLKVRQNNSVSELAWNISEFIRARVGAGGRESTESSWNDTLIATSDVLWVRQKTPGKLTSSWLEGDWSHSGTKVHGGVSDG